MRDNHNLIPLSSRRLAAAVFSNENLLRGLPQRSKLGLQSDVLRHVFENHKGLMRDDKKGGTMPVSVNNLSGFDSYIINKILYFYDSTIPGTEVFWID